ncbi:hypothetical protein FDW81_03260 [Pseudarthrobacter sp. NamB4]|nr:hypothetical protein FDW81_03260 [Pseudarthrobacter sp. NamB4]
MGGAGRAGRTHHQIQGSAGALAATRRRQRRRQRREAAPLPDRGAGLVEGEADDDGRLAAAAGEPAGARRPPVPPPAARGGVPRCPAAPAARCRVGFRWRVPAAPGRPAAVAARRFAIVAFPPGLRSRRPTGQAVPRNRTSSVPRAAPAAAKK